MTALPSTGKSFPKRCLSVEHPPAKHWVPATPLPSLHRPSLPQHRPAEPPLFQQQHRGDAEQLWCYTHHQAHLSLSEPRRSAPAAGTALSALAQPGSSVCAARFGAGVPLSTGAVPFGRGSFGTQGTARRGGRPALCLHPPEIHHFSNKDLKAPDFPPQFVRGVPNLHTQRAQSLLSRLQESQRQAWKGSGSSNISH